MSMAEINIIKAELTKTEHQEAVLKMVSAYAADPMGDGKPLSGSVRSRLIEGLLHHPTTLVFLATHGTEPCGIAVCFRGFSTFAAKPLINIHDFYVDPELRGRGIGRALLKRVECEARNTGCCKLTLEVQQNNSHAHSIYRKCGFAQTVLPADADGGGSLFMSKLLS